MRIEKGQVWTHTCTGKIDKILAVDSVYAYGHRIVVVVTQPIKGDDGPVMCWSDELFRLSFHRQIRLTDEIEALLDEHGIQI